MICPACQAENKATAKFCSECGTALALRCPGCGTPHRPGQRFCDECGTPLAAGRAAAAAADPVLPPAPAVAAGGLESPEMRLVSVLFVDLVGFTSLSEARDAEDVRELLGRYFDSARTIVERYGGTIEKFIGDAVMAVWGVPLAREDDAERAVRAALDVVDAVAVFGAEVGAPDLRARAGVVTGQVAALENPGEGLVVGDRVNTASRVQAAAPPGGVLVDEITRQVTSSAIAYEDAGEHMVKGKAEPIELWRAERVVAGVGGAEREQGLAAPFVGRDADLRLLKELFHGALERRSARLVAVSGEPGVGKSRLRREFTNYVDGIATSVLWHDGRCPSYGEGVAYWALGEMVRARLGIPEDAAPAVAAEKLAVGLERWVTGADDRDFLAPRLGALIGVGGPALGRDELFAGWRLFFERLADHQPVVLVFEDLQWAEPGLLEFIEQLLDWSASSPIFILTLARTEFGARHPGWPAGRRGATALQLDPLEDASMRQLLAGVVDLPEEAVRRIVARAEGIPLYAVETLRALAARGALAERDGRLVLAGELGELDVPATLGSLLAARLDALEPAERRLVKAMSVFGGAFPRSAAAALADVPEGELDPVLAALVRKQVFVIRTDRLSPDRGQYDFAQGLLRTVAYGMLSRQERKPRHLAAAEHLRRAFPHDGEEVAEVIAAQYLEAFRAAAGDADADALRAETVAALRRAAQRAATAGSPESAERSFRTAAELAGDEAERVDLEQLAGEMALGAGRHEAAVELLRAVADAHWRAGRPRAAARATRSLGEGLTRMGRAEESTAVVTDALNRLSADEIDIDAGWLHQMLARSLANQGRFAEAGAPLERALTIAEALGLEDLLCEALNVKGVAYLLMGRPREARLLFSGAVQFARSQDLGVHLPRALSNQANTEMEWDVPGAREGLEEALTIARRRGERQATLIIAGNLMLVHLFSGSWEEAERLGAEVLGHGEAATGAEDVHQRMALLHALRGDVTGARESLAHLGDWKDSDEREARALYMTARMAVSLAEGDLSAVVDQGRAELPALIADLNVSNENVRNSWPETLRAALTLGRLDDARELLALVSEEPAGNVPPYLRAQVARGHALLAAAEGRHDDVEADLRRAVAGLEDLGYPYWLAVARTDLARWLVDRGRAPEAADLLDRARASLEALGAAPALERAREAARATAAVS